MDCRRGPRWATWPGAAAWNMRRVSAAKPISSVSKPHINAATSPTAGGNGLLAPPASLTAAAKEATQVHQRTAHCDVR